LIQIEELVDRIWSRDPTVWTGSDEAQWLGWLDEPVRMRERTGDLGRFAEGVRADGLTTIVLLGMGGSSLAPEVLKRTYGVRGFHVLDTTHPAMIRHSADLLDYERTLFVAASKSGTTLETRSHLDFFWERGGKRGHRFAAITDPGSELESVARERGFREIFAGEPTIGGRYSALSSFGLVPAALMGIELELLLDRAAEMVELCRGEANPGLELGLRLGDGWREGRDKVCISETEGRFGLWAEQLLAESTGKEGKGLIPAPGESPAGPDRNAVELELDEPRDLGAEFFRWEFATAVAGSILGINPFDQPNVQEAKDRTVAILAGGDEPELEPEGSPEELFSRAREGDYVCIQAFIDPAREPELQPLIERARRETGCVVTHGLGPRYLHSTGQLHKGGPPTGLFLQVVDEPGDEVPIPNRDFGFRRLIRAQATGDYEALKERGLRVARVRLEEL
jgi:phosphoglucose isomerase-like protein